MKQEQVIELLKKHGVFVYQPKTPGSALMVQCSMEKVKDVIAMVEQATLERAAFECAAIAGLHGQSAKHEEENDEYLRRVGAKNAALECSTALRALSKEQQ